MTTENARSPYDVLGVSPDASEKEIKRAYRAIMSKNHPDRNPGDEAAKRRCQDAVDAYDAVKNGGTHICTSSSDNISTRDYNGLVGLFNELVINYPAHQARKSNLSKEIWGAKFSYLKTYGVLSTIFKESAVKAEQKKAKAVLEHMGTSMMQMRDIAMGFEMMKIREDIDAYATRGVGFDIKYAFSTINEHIDRMKMEADAIQNSLNVLSGTENVMRFNMN